MNIDITDNSLIRSERIDQETLQTENFWPEDILIPQFISDLDKLVENEPRSSYLDKTGYFEAFYLYKLIHGDLPDKLEDIILTYQTEYKGNYENENARKYYDGLAILPQLYPQHSWPRQNVIDKVTTMYAEDLRLRFSREAHGYYYYISCLFADLFTLDRVTASKKYSLIRYDFVKIQETFEKHLKSTSYTNRAKAFEILKNIRILSETYFQEMKQYVFEDLRLKRPLEINPFLLSQQGVLVFAPTVLSQLIVYADEFHTDANGCWHIKFRKPELDTGESKSIPKSLHF